MSINEDRDGNEYLPPVLAIVASLVIGVTALYGFFGNLLFGACAEGDGLCEYQRWFSQFVGQLVVVVLLIVLLVWLIRKIK